MTLGWVLSAQGKLAAVHPVLPPAPPVPLSPLPAPSFLAPPASAPPYLTLVALVAPTRRLAFSTLASSSAAPLTLVPCLAPALQGLLLLPVLLLLHAGPGQSALYNQCAVVEDQGAAGVVKGIW